MPDGKTKWMLYAPTGDFIAELTPAPLEIEWKRERAQALNSVVGALGIPFAVNATNAMRELDKAQCNLSRLCYLPKAPARGSTSRRKMKLRKAGLLP